MIQNHVLWYIIIQYLVKFVNTSLTIPNKQINHTFLQPIGGVFFPSDFLKQVYNSIHLVAPHKYQHFMITTNQENALPNKNIPV